MTVCDWCDSTEAQENVEDNLSHSQTIWYKTAKFKIHQSYSHLGRWVPRSFSRTFISQFFSPNQQLHVHRYRQNPCLLLQNCFFTLILTSNLFHWGFCTWENISSLLYCWILNESDFSLHFHSLALGNRLLNTDKYYPEGWQKSCWWNVPLLAWWDHK